jgi:riboflavin transporter FmnP
VNRKSKYTIKVALLSAMAFILMLFQFPLPIFPGFLQIDFSDLPALIGSFALGPFAGMVIEGLKNLLFALIRGTQTGGVGELSNFIVGSALVVPAGWVYLKYKTKKGALKGLVAGVLSMAVVASLSNYFLVLPLYQKVLGMPLEVIVESSAQVNSAIVDIRSLIIFGITPFNLVKGTAVSIVTILLYKRLSWLLHK